MARGSALPRLGAPRGPGSRPRHRDRHGARGALPPESIARRVRPRLRQRERGCGGGGGRGEGAGRGRGRCVRGGRCSRPPPLGGSGSALLGSAGRRRSAALVRLAIVFAHDPSPPAPSPPLPGGGGGGEG